jgi:hypothetical protein
VGAFDGHANNAWRNTQMKNFMGYKEISKFLASCRECEPFDPQFPARPRLVKKWWDSTIFEKHKDYIKQRFIPIGYGTFMVAPMMISAIQVVAKPSNESQNK